ncbi:MAG: SpoIID/LytB domain-containing protein [Candidatus Shapirobacteria bacterium]|nr:SpoIID/LytB domain-containing protein [Candidatus Shapirobacteria bacterium]
MYLKPKKILIFFLFLVFLFQGSVPVRKVGFIFASIDDDIANITKQIADLENAISPLRKESTGLQSKITSAKSQITQIEKQAVYLAQQLVEKESDLEVQKLLLSERVKRYYKNSKKFNSFMIFFSENESGSLFQQYAWYQSIISQDKDTITQYGSEIKILSDNKTKLEAEKVKLAKIKKDLESRFGFLATEIKKAETYKAELSAKQKALEAQKLASLNLPTSVGSGGNMMCTDDRKIDPGFGAGFAFFTYGIPHHVGLNQYGAYGRANAGQNYKDILNAYFNNVSIEKKSNVTLHINMGGGRTIDRPLEQYLLGIYEVPNSWPIEALKAQAVAARSYALAYTDNGAKSICTTQACQVFKDENKGGAWEQAVKATEGEVLVQGGQVVTAWFASTAGGYTYTSSDIGWKSTGWTKNTRDTSGDVNSFEDLQNKAYDKDSPCFYAAQGYRKEYNKSAWLKPSEVADIVNSILLSQRDSSINNNLLPPDQGGWSIDKVREELKSRGVTPYTNITSVSVSWDKGTGRTTQISLSGDGGSVNFDGSTFKSYFNARAPANISIVGPLFNVEKR